LQQLFGLPQEASDPGGQLRSGIAVPLSNSEIGTVLDRPTQGQTKNGKITGPQSGFISSAQPLRTVHESRFLLFDGVPVTRVQRVRNNGWGDSVFTRVFEVLRDYHLSWGGVCNLLQDYAQGVYKLEGLNDLMTAGDDGAVASRAQLIDLTRSIARAIVLDAGGDGKEPESFERNVASLTGLPEIMQQLALRLASAARMPVSLLLGQAPAGLNATGDSDIRWYYDRIKAKQKEILQPALHKFMQIVFAAKDGPTNGQEPENWSIHFPALWQLDSLQEAQRRNFIAQSDNIYVQMGAVTPSEVGISRFSDDEYNGDSLTLDMDTREAMNQPEEELKALAAGTQMGMGNKPDGSPADPEPAKGMATKTEADKAAEDTSPRTNPAASV
jgi:hypothetical protein